MRIITKNKIIKNPKYSYQNTYYIIIIISVSVVSFFYLCSPSIGTDYKIYAQNQTQIQNQTVAPPRVTDPKLKVELVARDFDFPTSIEFLAKDDIVLLEKNTGDVYRIINGNVTGPIIHMDVAFKDERGLLGVAVSKNGDSNTTKPYVFLYYTQCVKNKSTGAKDCHNYVYRYEFDSINDKLINPKLILSLPGLPGPSHNGGVLEVDKDKNLYVTIGDVEPTNFNQTNSTYDTKAQNIMNGTSPDGRAGILRITQDGKPVGNGVLNGNYPLNLYYAYGIKNSFGIGFDPITGNLWDTENGPQFGDEINLVKPGFNSGWQKVQGIWKLNETREKDGIFNARNEVEFVGFNGKGKYSSPEFVWDNTVAPTALVFLNSDKLGKDYQNDIFVGSVKQGTIYHFDLNKDRQSLSLGGDLADLVLNKYDDTSKIIFGQNFGIITDLEVGPDGYLYVVSGIRGTDEGSIYRIVLNE